MKINDIEVVGDYFFYDWCHKIYIVEDIEDIKSMEKHDYDINTALFNIRELESIYNNSCPLKFISNCKLTIQYAEQCEGVDFS